MLDINKFQDKCKTETDNGITNEEKWDFLIIKQKDYGTSYYPKISVFNLRCPNCNLVLNKINILHNEYANFKKILLKCSCGYEFASSKSLNTGIIQGFV